MNEENKNIQPEKTGLDETKKNAMLRYIAIMFAVAFIFVLLSLVGQMRDTEAALSQLNQSSSSALEKAEQLQDHNRELESENAYLAGRIEELEKQLMLTEAETQSEQLEADLSEAEQQATAIGTELDNTKKAYSLLAKAQTLAAAEQDPSTVLAELEAYTQYLDEHAQTILENLTNKGEE